MPYDVNTTKRIREELDISIWALAARTYVTPQTIINWETGRSNPSVMKMDALYEFCRQNGIPRFGFYIRPDGLFEEFYVKDFKVGPMTVRGLEERVRVAAETESLRRIPSP